MNRRLYRSETERMVGGVCGGLADYFQVDPTLVRVAFVLLALLNGLGLIGYVVLWIIVPRQSRLGTATQDTMRENVEEVTEQAREWGEKVRGKLGGGERRGSGPYLWAGILILVGLLLLLNNYRLLWWFDIGRLWPLVIIAIGVALLLRRGS